MLFRQAESFLRLALTSCPKFKENCICMLLDFGTNWLAQTHRCTMSLTDIQFVPRINKVVLWSSLFGDKCNEGDLPRLHHSCMQHHCMQHHCKLLGRPESVEHSCLLCCWTSWHAAFEWYTGNAENQCMAVAILPRCIQLGCLFPLKYRCPTQRSYQSSCQTCMAN